MKKRMIILGLVIIFISNIALYLYLENFYKSAHYKIVEENLISFSTEMDFVYSGVRKNRDAVIADFDNDIMDRYILKSNSIINHLVPSERKEDYIDSFNRESKNDIVVLNDNYSPINSVPIGMKDIVGFVKEYFEAKEILDYQIINSPFGEVFVRSDQDLTVLIKIDNEYENQMNDVNEILLDYIENRVGTFDEKIRVMIFDLERDIAISNSKIMELSEAVFYYDNKLLLNKSANSFIVIDKYCKVKEENISIYGYVNESVDKQKIIVSFIEESEIVNELSKYNKLIISFIILSVLTLLIVGFLLHDLLDIGSR